MTTLIGRNDIGKSTILEALEIFFNNDVVKMDVADKCVSSAEASVEITCEFSEFPDRLVLDALAETSLADEYLLTADNTLKIKKIFRCDGAKPKEEVYVIANHPAAAGVADLLELTNANLKKRLADSGVDVEGVQQNVNTSIRRALWSNCEGLQLQEKAINVAKEDGKLIWEKLEPHLPMFALFQSDRPSRDSDSEVQDPMKLAISAALAEDGIQAMLSEVVDAVRAKATELADRTRDVLKRIDPALAQQLVPEFKAEPKWPGIFSLSLLGDEGIPVNKRGSGVRRLVLVSFFRAEAERKRSEGGVKNIIYAIEEPETSQHPNNQKLLLEALQELSSENGCQVILTTHSPGFAVYLPTESFRFIDKGCDGEPEIFGGAGDVWNKVVEALGVIPDSRVRVLVCVEGPNDVLALRALSDALHQADPTIISLKDDPRVAFVVLGGGALEHWVNEHYLKGIGRPECHIYDSDVAKYAASIAQVNQRGDGSWGVQTAKLEIENYLHDDAVREGLAIQINVSDAADIPDLVARALGGSHSKAKRILARQAFPKMDANRLRQRDQIGEVEGWLRRIEATID